MSDVTHPARGRVSGWARLLGFVLANFYLFILVFLVIWVVVPSVGLGMSPVVIDSGSMKPGIDPGDVVLIDPDLPSEFAVGGVVTFRDGDRLVTHRVVGRDDDGAYRTKGDANRDPDSNAVDDTEVVGLGRLLVPMIGAPARWVRTNPAALIVWLAATAAAILVALRAPTEDGDPADEGPSDPDGAREQASAHRGRPRQLPALLDRLAIVLGPRLLPGRLRSWTPLASALGASLALVRPIGLGLVAAVITTTAVLVVDPRGPHVPVGRLTAAWTRRVGGRPRASWQLDIPVLRLGTALGLVAVVISAPTGRTSAVFAAPTDNVGSSFTVAGCAGSGTQTVLATADAYIHEDGPDHQHGGKSEIEVRGEVGKTHRSLVSFPALSIPTECTVTGATLSLYVHNLKEPTTLRVLRVTGAWDEQTVSWNTQPGVTGAGTTAAAVAADTWVDWDVTAAVAAWHGGAAVHGLELRDEDEADDHDTTVLLRARENGTGAATTATLTVTW